MFGIGFWELCLVLLVALMVLGPERLPVVARKLGYWTGRARTVANAVREQLEQEVADAEAAAERVVNPTPPPKDPSAVLSTETTKTSQRD